MNNQQMMMNAAYARMIRKERFYKNHDRCKDLVEYYKDFSEKELLQDYSFYKAKLFWKMFFYFLFMITGVIIAFSGFGVLIAYNNDDGDYSTSTLIKFGITFSVGIITFLCGVLFAKNYNQYHYKKTFLGFKIESSNYNYSLQDIKDMDYFKLKKFISTPPVISPKYDFLCGVYAVHCLHLPYDIRKDSNPIFLVTGLGFRYDAWLVVDKIKSEWKKYKKSSNYDGLHKDMFDHLNKYNLSINSVRITFIQNIDSDLESALDYWYDKLDIEEDCWF